MPENSQYSHFSLRDAKPIPRRDKTSKIAFEEHTYMIWKDIRKD
jgi:hypothetical protein